MDGLLRHRRPGRDVDQTRFALAFGPTAWFINEKESGWRTRVDPADADYSHVFLWRWNVREIRQSSVTLLEVLDRLKPTDTRLHDEIMQLISGDRAGGHAPS